MGRKALNVDNWVLNGHVRFMWVIGTQWIESSQGSQNLGDYLGQHTVESPQRIEGFDPEDAIATLKARADAGNMVLINNDIYLRTIGNQYADLVLPAATWGEEDFTRAQGERVIRIYSKFYDPPGQAKPDWWIIAEVAKKMGLDGYNWRTSQDVFKESARFTRNSRKDYAPLLMYAKVRGKEPYDLLRERGATGYQGPLRIHDGQLIETKSLHRPHAHIESTQGISVKQKRLGSFTKNPGKMILHIADWNLFKDYYDRITPKKEKGELWVTCGRVNEIWQSVFDDLRKPYIMQRYPMNFVELHPHDAAARGLINGDIVAMENDDVYVQVGAFNRPRHKDFLFTNLEKDGYIKRTKGAVSAMVFVDDAVKPGVAFMYFMWPGGAASNSLAPAVADPLTNAPRYKLAKARFRKIGSIPDEIKRKLTFKPKDVYEEP
jgi:arsenite oxidase large subunit